MIAYAPRTCYCEDVKYVGSTMYVYTASESTTAACDCDHDPVETVVYIHPPASEPDPLDEEGWEEPRGNAIDLDSAGVERLRGPPDYAAPLLELILYAPLLARPPPGRFF